MGQRDDASGDGSAVPVGAISCAEARELASAAADDELTLFEQRRLDRHVVGCAACAAFVERLAALSRSIRLRAASSDHLFVERVLDRARPPRLGRGGWMRPALAWCGVVIAVQAMPALVLGELDGAATHIARHVGAAAVALAIGLLYAAWRPQRAFGLLPLVGALLVANLAGALFDTLDGDRAPVAETVHVAEVVGMVLLWMVAGSPGWDRVRGLFHHHPGGGLASHR